MTAGDVMDRAAALLNDSAKSIYTYTVQIPFLKQVLKTFEGECYDLGLPKVYKWSGDLTVTAGQTDLDTAPSDLQIPVLLYEKTPGQTDDYYTIMHGPAPLPPRAAISETLGEWDYIEDAVAFIACANTRSVKMYYQKTIANISDQSSTVFTGDSGSLELLALWLARDLAIIIGGSDKRGNNLEVMRQKLFDVYIGPKLGIKQAMPVRRIPYGGNSLYTRR